MSGTDHTQENPKNPAPCVILIEPQLGENIGTAARAMANFGLHELRLVSPRDGWPNERAVKAASGADWIIEGAALYEEPPQSVSDLNYVYATTARPRGIVKPVITPEQAALDMRARIAAGQKVGVMFGRERFGLRNEEIKLADVIVMAPVNPAFASINVAQAVLLVGYEWYKHEATTLGQETPQEAAMTGPGLPQAGSRPATKEELEGFFGHIERELTDCGFLRPIEKAPSMMRNIRAIYSRCQLTEQEVRSLRGIVSGLTYTHTRGKQGE